MIRRLITLGVIVFVAMLVLAPAALAQEASTRAVDPGTALDFQSAALLVIAILGAVELTKRLSLKYAGIIIDDGLTQVVAILWAIGLIFLVRATIWSDTQVIGGHKLEDLNVASIIFAGILFGLGSGPIERLIRGVANIGENNPKPPGTVNPPKP